ncbi:MAG: nitroreductase family protein [Spirochaetota bacterium]
MVELLARRRSIRAYTDKPISPQHIEALTEAALYSVSSRAIRPWELVVVDDANLMQALSRAKKHGSSFLAGAPLAFVIVGKPSESDVWIEDCSILSSNVLLEAEALGLGACWIQIRERNAADGTPSQEVVKQLLSIPSDRSVESIIAVGHPDEKKSPYTRDELHWEKVHKNRY